MQINIIEAKYKATKFKEKVQRKIAWLLPRSIVMWAYIRVVLHATNNKWGHTVVPDITAMEALKRWDESNEGALLSSDIANNKPATVRGTYPSQADIGENYMHTNSKGVTYYLNMKHVTLRGGKITPIYYFSKDYRSDVACPLPTDYQVNENPRNGFLTIKTPSMIAAEANRTEDDHED